jgi:fatty acid desaturase
MSRLSLPQYLQKRSDRASTGIVIINVAVVLGSVYLAAALGFGWSIAPLWLWFGLSLNSLLNLMHEAAHSLVFQNRRGSEILGRWVLGPLVLADFDGYRDRHWEHHKHLGEAGDTKDTYLISIRGWGMLFLIARCLILIEAGRKLAHQLHTKTPALGPSKRTGVLLARIVVAHALLGSSLLAVAWAAQRDLSRALLSATVAYGLVYLYGLGSLTVFAAIMRAVAEHQIGGDGSMKQGRAALRNFNAGPLSRFFLGAYGFAEHATHHYEPAIPYYRLPAATESLMKSVPGLTPRESYFGTLRQLSRSLPRELKGLVDV